LSVNFTLLVFLGFFWPFNEFYFLLSTGCELGMKHALLRWWSEAKAAEVDFFTT